MTTKTEIEILKKELAQRRRAMNNWGQWYQCSKCGEYNQIGFVCYYCGHDRTL